MDLHKLPDSTALLSKKYESIRIALLAALTSPKPAGWGLPDLKSAENLLKREMADTCVELYKRNHKPHEISVEFLHALCWARTIKVDSKDKVLSKDLQNLDDMAVSLYNTQKSNPEYKGYALEYHFFFELTKKREQEAEDLVATSKPGMVGIPDSIRNP